MLFSLSCYTQSSSCVALDIYIVPDLVLVELHCEDSHEISTPYISFKRQNLSNNSYVDITEVGRAGNGSDSIQCRSELQNCSKWKLIVP